MCRRVVVVAEACTRRCRPLLTGSAPCRVTYLRREPPPSRGRRRRLCSHSSPTVVLAAPCRVDRLTVPRAAVVKDVNAEPSIRLTDDLLRLTLHTASLSDVDCPTAAAWFPLPPYHVHFPSRTLNCCTVW